MAEEGEDGQEKTEEPTQKRKDDAREKGQVLTSKEIFVFANMALASVMLLMAQNLLPTALESWRSFFVFGPIETLESTSIHQLGRGLWGTIWAGLIVGVPLLMITILSQFGMGGINFSTQAIGFKAEKLDPLKGLKRMVSLNALVELTKAILKVVLLVSAAAIAIWPVLGDFSGYIWMSAGDATAAIQQNLIILLVAMTIGLGIIASIDLSYQIYSLTKKLKMSRQEIKDEMKESEGSPEVKGQIRQKQLEASRRAAERASVDQVGEATAIITNPSHFAVALRYIPDEMDAPIVVAMGKNAIAHMIKDSGKRHLITTLEIPHLARALYFTSEIGEVISEQLFAAVAIILAHIHHLDRGHFSEMPDINLPEHLYIDEFGRRIDPKES